MYSMQVGGQLNLNLLYSLWKSARYNLHRNQMSSDVLRIKYVMFNRNFKGRTPIRP
jgi:hypothetical protein